VPTQTIQQFAGLDLRDDVQEQPGAIDLLNVDLDQRGRVRVRDGYSKVTAAAGATRYDSIFSIAGAAAVSSTAAIAGTGANDATVTGTGWTNPGNVTADDGSYATVTVALNAHSQYVKGTNFGFAVPGGATIVGIVAEVERNVPAGNAIDFSVRLFKAGVATGSDLAAYSWPATDAVATYGSSSELWGTTWTPADVNAATFGVGISVKGHSAFAVNPQVDYIKITVYYSTPSNLAVGGAAAARLDVIDSTGTLVGGIATASDSQSSYVAFGSPATSAVYIANSGTTVRKLVGTTFSTPAGMPKAKFVGLQTPDNRLVAANIATIPTGAASTASTSLVHFSDAGAPETWSANSYVYLTPGDNEDIQGLVTWRGGLYVFKSSRFFRFFGNSADTTGQPVFNYREVDGAGLAAPLGVAAAPDGIYFIARRGIYFTTGGPPQRISDPVGALFLGGAQDSYQSGVINPSALAQASMCWFSDRLYVGLPLGSATTNSHTLVYDPQTRAWTLWNIPMGAMAATASQPARLLFTYAQGTDDIGQYAQHAYTDDAGTAITSKYRTGFLDFGAPEQEKWIRQMMLSGTGTVNVKTAVNDATTLSSATSVAMGTSPAVGTGRWSAGTRGRDISVDISAASGAWSLSHLSLDVAATRAPGVRAA
jgi:hypothetical protein